MADVTILGSRPAVYVVKSNGVALFNNRPLVQVLASTAASVGENNTASNVGSGAGVYKQKVGVNLEFKTLLAGTNVSLVAGPNEITINSTAAPLSIVSGSGLTWNGTDRYHLGGTLTQLATITGAFGVFFGDPNGAGQVDSFNIHTTNGFELQQGTDFNFTIGGGSAVFTDSGVTKAGIEYDATTATGAGFTANSLINKGFADGAYAPLVGGGYWALATGGTLTGNNTITMGSNTVTFTGNKVTFNSGAAPTYAPIRLLGDNSDPSSLENGDIWVNFAGQDTLKYRGNAESRILTYILGGFTNGIPYNPTSTGGLSTSANLTFDGTGLLVGGGTITANTRVDIRGIGTTTNNIVRLADSANTERWRFDDAGVLWSNSGRIDGISGSNALRWAAGQQVGSVSSQLQFLTLGGTYNGVSMYVSNGTVFTATSGDQSVFGVIGNFAPTSGTAVFRALTMYPTLNVTGGTTTVYGIDYNPTLTSMTGATHIAFRSTSGAIVFGSTSSDGLTTGSARVVIGRSIANIIEFRNTSNETPSSISLTTDGFNAAAAGRGLLYSAFNNYTTTNKWNHAYSVTNSEGIGASQITRHIGTSSSMSVTNSSVTGEFRYSSGEITINTTGGTTTLVGYNWDPTLTSTTGLTHLAWRNTSGNVLIGATTITANTRVDIRGIGTTTNLALRVADSGNTARFYIKDSGQTVVTFQGDDVEGLMYGTEGSSRVIHSINGTSSTVAISGITGASTVNWSMRMASSTQPMIYTQRSTGFLIRNDAGDNNVTSIINLITGSVNNSLQPSTTTLRTAIQSNLLFNPSVSAANIAMVVFAPEMRNSGSYAGNTYWIYKNNPKINLAGGTTTVYGYDYDPTLTSTTGLTHIALRATSGSILIGHTSLGATTTRMQVRGIGTGSGKTALFEDSAGTFRYAIQDNGQHNYFADGTDMHLSKQGTSFRWTSESGGAFEFNHANNLSNSVTNGFLVYHSGVSTALTGVAGLVRFTALDSRSTSSSGQYSHMILDGTINQTSVSGATRAIYIRPTLTSVSGDYIAYDYDPSVTSITGNHIAAYFRSGAVRLGAINNDDALTQVLVRDGTTGEIKYRTAASLGGGGGWAVTGTTTLTGAVTIDGNTNTLDFIDLSTFTLTTSGGIEIAGSSIDFAGRATFGSGDDASLVVGSHTADHTTPVDGLIYYNTTTDKFRFRQNAAWVELGGGSGPEFEDDVFRVIDEADNTKKVAFEVSGVTTATTRTLTVPNANGTIALTSDLSGWLTGTLTGDIAITGGAGVDFSLTTSGNISLESSSATLLSILGDATPITIESNGALLTLTAQSIDVNHIEGFILPASTTTYASITIPHGTAPTAPVNGDIWTTTAGLFARINGATVGPYGIGTIIGSTGSIDNAILRANGTGGVTVQASPVTIGDTGDITIGNTSTSGNRTISTDATETTSGLDIIAKGNTYINLRTSGTTSALVNVAGAGGVLASFNFSTTTTTHTFTAGNVQDAGEPFIITGRAGTASGIAGANLILVGGNGAPSGNSNGGHIYLQVGAKNASGLDGNIGFLTSSVSNWQSMQRGMFVLNALAAPTGNPSAGMFLWSDAADGDRLTFRNTSGSVYDISKSVRVVNHLSATLNEAATKGEKIILANATSNNITVNLPAAAGNTAMFHIKKTDSSANTVTIDGNSTETIDGATTHVLTDQYQSVTIVSDGSNWFII